MFAEENLKYTSALEDAMVAVSRATDSQGLKIILVNPTRPEAVAARLEELVGWVQPGNVPVGAPSIAAGYLNTLTHIHLLATLLAEHINADNYHPEAMRAA